MSFGDRGSRKENSTGPSERHIVVEGDVSLPECRS